MVLKIMKGYVISIFLFILMMLLFTALLRFTPLPEKSGFTYVVAGLSVAALVFGIFTGGAVGAKGILVGLMSSVFIVSSLIFLIISIISADISADLLNVYFLIPTASGILGGILGTNLKK